MSPDPKQMRLYELEERLKEQERYAQAQVEESRKRALEALTDEELLLLAESHRVGCSSPLLPELARRLARFVLPEARG